MPNYTCSTCGKIFNDKFNYTTHLKRKFPCKPKSNINQNESLRNQNEIQNTKEYKCGYCGKNFSTNSNWNRHTKEYCKVKNEKVMEENTIFGQLKEQINEQNKEIEKIKKQNEEINENEKLKEENNKLQNIINNVLLNDKKSIDLTKNEIDKSIIDINIYNATSSNQINSSENNNINDTNIFTNEEKKYIISKFPKSLHEYLNKVNNPLDETQVIIGLLQEKNIRIILNYEENMFGIYEWKGYYHATNIKNELGCSTVDNWKQWNINFKKFNEFENKNLVHKIYGQGKIGPIFNFDIKKINVTANFIDDEGLKTILLKTTKKTPEIKLFKEWIIKYSTIAKSVISMIMQIKQQYENELLKKQLNNNQITYKTNEITYFYEINNITPYLDLNVLYFGETGETITINNKEKMVFKLGKSIRSIRRDLDEHKKKFPNFKMIFIIHCDNNDVVENYLKMELKAKNLIYRLPKKSKENKKKLTNNEIEEEEMEETDEIKEQKYMETFILRDNFDIKYIIDLMERLVESYPLNSIKERDDKIKELVNNNKLREKELDLKIKEEETKQKQIEIEKEIKIKQMENELELAKIKLEMMKMEYTKMR